MCCCGNLIYAKKNHAHSSYTTKTDVDAAIAASGHVNQAAVDAAIAASGHVNQAAVDAAIAASGHVNQAAVDAAIEAAIEAAVPIGSITIWAGTGDPPGGTWLICDGRGLSKTTYSELYSIIGDNFDYGTPKPDLFVLPDFAGRSPFGVSDRDTEFTVLGAADGEKSHTLTQGEMPIHSHPMLPGYFPGRDVANPTIAVSSGNTWSQGSIGNAGGGQPHNNLPPFLVVNFIIKVLP